MAFVARHGAGAAQKCTGALAQPSRAGRPRLHLLGSGRVRSLFLTLVLLLAWSPRAHAEDIAAYEVEGEADVGGADPRIAALDEAFGRAVSSALLDVLDSDVRKANKPVVDREIVGRARLWVVKFSVTKDGTADGRRQLTVTVRVDRDKMRTRLGELNIGTAGPGEQPAPGARTGIVLLRISDGATTRADFGATAEKDLPGLGALASVLRAGGITIKRAPSTGPAARAGGDLPIEDDEAEALVGEAKAELAVIAGVTVGAPVAVRGVETAAVLVTAHVRVIGHGKKLVGHGTAAVAARGSEPSVVGAAIDRALVGAAADVLPEGMAQPQGFRGDDSPIAEPGVVMVRLAPRTPYVLVAAELKHLAGAKGVSRAVLRRLSPSGWVIGVTTAESVQRISNIVKKPPTSDTSVQVRIVGDLVEVGLSAGAP
ncbi:MAG: hypothetical protein H6Q90_2269 [Deltaproteobacteria bacterium]|nr:hypothetical protein [Deltaproteobacteria bacterium]